MTHKEAYELLEELAFATLESDEADRVEAHLETGCLECNDRYRQLVELSARLATAVPQHDPSPRIKAKLFERVRDETAEDRPKTPRYGLYFGWSTAAIAAAVALFLFIQISSFRDQFAGLKDDLAGKDEEIAELKSALSTHNEDIAALVQNLSESRSETDSLRLDLEETRNAYASLQNDLATRLTEIESMRRELAAYEDATLLLGQPGMQFVDLEGVEPNEQAFGKVVIDPNRGTGIVYMYRLPQTPEGMEYQLWVLREGKPTSVGTFTVADDGSAMLSLKSIPTPTEIASFNVTIEPLGGMPEPTGMMYLTGPEDNQ